MSTINIHGKEYEPVASRVKRWRAEHPLWSHRTEVLVDDGDRIMMRVTIYDEEGRAIGDGIAQERYGEGKINRTSAPENCQTGAMGRALGFIGYDLAGESIATAEDIHRAARAPAPKPKPKPKPEIEGAATMTRALGLSAAQTMALDQAVKDQSLDAIRALYKRVKLDKEARKDPIPGEWKAEALRKPDHDPNEIIEF